MPEHATDKKIADALKKLRKIIGVSSQEKFAKMVGVSFDTIKNAESRGKGLSKATARKISILIGVCPSGLLEGKVLHHVRKDRFTEADYHAWRSQVFRPDQKVATKMATDIGFWVKVLYAASVESGSGSLHPLHIEVAKALDEIADTFGLVPAINKHLRENYEFDDSLRLTGEQWRAADPLIQAYYGFKDSKRIAKYDFYTLTVRPYPGWRPEGGVPQSALEKAAADSPRPAAER